MRRSCFRFSMATLLVIVTVVAVWLARTSNSAREQEAAVKEVEKREGDIQFDSKFNVPEWLRNVVGEEYFRRVKVVGFATNHGRKSGSTEPKATDENLRMLESLTDVETLELSHSEEVTDVGLVHLKPLKNLSTLYLHRTGVRGPGLVHIAQLPKLKAIRLSHSELEDSGLEYLGSMSRLTSARLDHTKITDAGLSDLVKATQLETLTLRNTSIGDAGLRQLEQLKRLAFLDVAGTGVTADGVEHFKQALPGCRLAVTFSLGKMPSDELLFPTGYQPSATEVNAKLKELKIDGEVKADASKPGNPIVSLRLEGCTLSDKVVLSLIEHMPELDILNFNQGMVGDELLVGIGGRPIRYLSLQGTRVTDAGLQHLSQLTTVTTLVLSETDVTDEGLLHLHGLSNLNSVILDDTRTTRRGVTKLKEALPNW